MKELQYVEDNIKSAIHAVGLLGRLCLYKPDVDKYMYGARSAHLLLFNAPIFGTIIHLGSSEHDAEHLGSKLTEYDR